MNGLQRLRERCGVGEARALYELIMQERFGLSRADLLLGKDTTLSADDQALLQEIVERVAKGEPVQYVLGYETFCGRRFRVSPDVLIPRPETAQLVDLVNRYAAPGSTILDIGTGSGCIAVTLALKGFDVTAFDVSPQALSVARDNAEVHGAQVNFCLEDILQPSEREMVWDVIVSNPPYVCRSEAEAMDDNVLLHEPHLALFVPDDDPLRFYRAIADYADRHLSPNGMLLFEVNRTKSGDVAQLLLERGCKEVWPVHDMFDNERFVCARR